MIKLGWLVLAAAACGHKDSGGAGSGSGSPVAKAPRPALSLARCVDAPPSFAPPVWGYGRIGHGSGTGTSQPFRHYTSTPTTSIGQPNAQGDLDKAIIRRYVKRNLSRITYCYEKELLVKPNISGSIQVQFFISPEGKVASADAHGFDPTVASCVADVIKQIEFPKPRGGGGVQVNYPFNFRPAGAGSLPNPLPAPPPPPPTQQQLYGGLLAPTSDKPLEQWTPFARAAHAFDAGGTAATDAAVAEVVKNKLPELDRCFDASDATGSLRVMIELDQDKGVTAVRAGGLGDAAVEQCVATAVRSGNFAPATQQHEVACDLVRGSAQPWRATIGRDYTLVGVTGAGLVLDGQPRKPGEHHIVPEHVALVVIEPDAAPATIADALQTAADAPAALVAVHGKTAELVGVTPAPDADAEWTVEVTESAGIVRACFQSKDAGSEAALANPGALTASFGAWAKLCPRGCELRVAATTFASGELPAVAAAARAAGFDVLGIAADPKCAR